MIFLVVYEMNVNRWWKEGKVNIWRKKENIQEEKREVGRKWQWERGWRGFAMLDGDAAAAAPQMLTVALAVASPIFTLLLSSASASATSLVNHN